MRQILALLLLSITQMALGQDFSNGSVSGKLTDEQGSPMEFATIMLLQASDSSLAKGGITDDKGFFEIGNIKAGDYYIAASSVGYNRIFSEKFSISASSPDHQVGTLAFDSGVTNLEEVVVVGEKPFIEQKLDKIVMNVENSLVAAGGTALEVLEKAPGVIIDSEGRISLRGRQGVIVMIDGKRTFLSEDELNNMLRNMQSDAIASIDIITNPSAKYDAAGNSGIIDIKLKKNQQAGMNGSVNLNAGYGAYPKLNGGTNLNYRNGRFNTFANLNAGHFESFNNQTIERYVTNNNNTTLYEGRNNRVYDGQNFSYKGGIDYNLTDNSTIGVMANGFMSQGTGNMVNRTNMYNAGNVSRNFRSQPDSVLNMINNTTRSFENNSINLNYRNTFDTTSRELNFDVDYSRFNTSMQDNLRNEYLTGAGVPYNSPLILRSNMPSVIDILSANIDYTHPLTESSNLEMGWKSSIVSTDNDAVWEIDQGEDQGFVPDPLRSNQFLYDENINAAYLNYNGALGAYKVQVGLRAEHTKISGNSVTTQSVVEQEYTKLFPSVFVNRDISKNHNVGINFSRRIDRPNYRNLNPFLYFLDPLTYFEGNPYLQPQFTNNYQFNYSWKGMIITSIGYSETQDVFTQVTRQNDATGVTIASMENLDVLRNYNFNLSAPIDITDWWTMNNNVTVFYNQYLSQYLGEQLDNSQFSYNINTNNTFKFGNDFSGEITGFYNAPTVDGIINIRSMYMLSAGIQKQFWDKKASVKLNVNDIFNTMRFQGDINYANMDLDIYSNWESRQVRLSFSYRFGSNDIKPSRRRTGSGEQERNRVEMEN